VEQFLDNSLVATTSNRKSSPFFFSLSHPFGDSDSAGPLSSFLSSAVPAIRSECNLPKEGYLSAS
jgi:hypothetical protein